MSEDTECPTCGRDDFESEHGVKTHHSVAHDEPLRETTECAHCGDEFQGRSGQSKYCSRDCASASRRDRVELVCESCGDTFTVQASQADYRVHCSQDCYSTAKSDQEWRTCAHCDDPFKVATHSDQEYCSVTCANHDRRNRVTETCVYCDDEFKKVPSSPQEYCSRDCVRYAQGTEVDVECQGCGAAFTRLQHKDRIYCSDACRNEAKTKRELPAHPALAVWVLYEFEDRSIDETYRRYRAHFGYDNRLPKQDVRELVDRIGVFNEQERISSRLEDMDPDEILGELPGASDGQDCQDRSLRGDVDA